MRALYFVPSADGRTTLQGLRSRPHYPNQPMYSRMLRTLHPCSTLSTQAR